MQKSFYFYPDIEVPNPKLTFYHIQYGPSLESTSYLNVTLRYPGPWDLGTPGPWVN